MPESTTPASAAGSLIVAVTTARGTLPIEGALVTVSAQQNGAPVLYRAARTDSSGRTPPLSLPAPPLAGSITPDQAIPYASYTVEVSHPGYQPVSAQGVPVFPGVAATLPVGLTPRTAGQRPVSIEQFPPQELDRKEGAPR